MLFESLTRRENEVANLLMQLLTNKEIAQRLNLSERAIKFHVGSIYRKFDSHGSGKMQLILKICRRAGVTIAAMLFLCVSGYAQHSNAITWTQPTQPSGETISSTNVKRDGAILTMVTPTVLAYTDTNVSAGESHVYTLTNVDSNGVESSASAPVTAVTPQDGGTTPPICPSCPVIGNTIKVTGIANVRATAVTSKTSSQWGKALGTFAAGSTGTVTGNAVAADGTFFWIQVKEATCTGSALVAAACTGWMGSDNMTITTTTPPAIIVKVTPATATIPIGGTQQFVAAVTNATDSSVTWSTNAPSGLFAASASGTFVITATSNQDPTKSSSATVTVPAPALTWTCSGNTCTVGGGASGQKATATLATPNGNLTGTVTVQ